MAKSAELTWLDALEAEGLRAEVNSKGERMNLKIRHAQQQKVPYMMIVGDKEASNDTVSVRLRSEEDLGPMQLTDLMQRLADQSRSRQLDPEP